MKLLAKYLWTRKYFQRINAIKYNFIINKYHITKENKLFNAYEYLIESFIVTYIHTLFTSQ